MKQFFFRIWADIRRYYPVAGIFLVYYAVVHAIFQAFCPLLILTGFPCAGCGMTRALLCILTGQLTRAWQLNPSAFAWAAWGIYAAVCRYILGRKSKWTTRLLAAVCVITLVIYAYRMATQFPGDPPMTYYRRNLLSRVYITLRNM